MELTVTCSRCGHSVKGAQIKDGANSFTSGFYNVSGTQWAKYARPGESVLCDACMTADPTYQKDYAPNDKPSEATDSNS